MFRGKQRVNSDILLLMESLIDDIGSQTGYGYFSPPVITLEGLGHEAMARELCDRLSLISRHMEGQQDTTYGSGNETDSDPRRIIKETAAMMAQQVKENIRKGIFEDGGYLSFGCVQHFTEMMERLADLLNRLDNIQDNAYKPDTPRPQCSPRDPLRGVHD